MHGQEILSAMPADQFQPSAEQLFPSGDNGRRQYPP